MTAAYGRRATGDGKRGAPRLPSPVVRLPFLLCAVLLLECRATTARPSFVPLPTAASAELELDIPSATRAVAERLAQDSIALSSVVEKDGFIDSGWLDAATLEHTDKPPIGREVVRVRVWVNPSRDFWSEVVIEATYRAIADPSRPDRELDLPLPEDHPVQKRLAGSIRKLIEQYGDADALKALAAQKPAGKPDSAKAKPDSVKVKPDSAKARRDTVKVKPDTIPAPVDR